MATNQTIEAPNFEKINKEAGQFTADAISTLWAALNDTRKTERTDFRIVRDILAPKVKQLAPTASVDDLSLDGCSVVEFTGSASVNFTGMKAPETGRSQVVFVYVSGTGTITAVHNATSATANQLDNASAANVTLATRGGIVYIYLSGKWREIA